MTETNLEKRLISYARVSTYGQPLDNQLEQLRAAGCTSRNIYREKVTSARPDRRELLRMFKRLTPVDVVTVTRIDRLARSTIDLFGIVTYEAVRKSVNAEKISRSKAVRASRRPLCAFLSMRYVIDRINERSSS